MLFLKQGGHVFPTKRVWCGTTRIGKLTGKEAVELDKHLEVDVVALGSLAVRVPHMVAVEIDTCLTHTKSMVSLMIWYAQSGPASRLERYRATRQQPSQCDRSETETAAIFPTRSRDCHGSQTRDRVDPRPLAHKGSRKDASRTHLED